MTNSGLTSSLMTSSFRWLLEDSFEKEETTLSDQLKSFWISTSCLKELQECSTIFKAMTSTFEKITLLSCNFEAIWLKQHTYNERTLPHLKKQLSILKEMGAQTQSSATTIQRLENKVPLANQECRLIIEQLQSKIFFHKLNSQCLQLAKQLDRWDKESTEESNKQREQMAASLLTDSISSNDLSASFTNFKELKAATKWEIRQVYSLYLNAFQALYLIEQTVRKIGIEILSREATRRIELSRLSSTADVLYCPLTKQIFVDPCIVSSGYTFERQAILEHLKNNPYCPLSGELLNPTVCISNLAIKFFVANHAEIKKAKSD